MASPGVVSRRELSEGRRYFLSDVDKRTSEVWKISLYASPVHMRRRNVYDKHHPFWKLIEPENNTRQNFSILQNIENLQKKVPIWGSASSILELPSPKKRNRNSIIVDRDKNVVGSLCSQHNWECVSKYRLARLGYVKHSADAEKCVQRVSDWSKLCLDLCCKRDNLRLFHCLEKCCWGREKKLAEGKCDYPCCADITRDMEADPEVLLESTLEYKLLQDETETVLGFVRHGPGLKHEKKGLFPVNSGFDLCNQECCLYDNMQLFRAENWTTLKNVGLKR